MKIIELDGSQGEGGGQILRTALSLSMVTGRAFRIINIRAKRPKPGLLRQHLTAIKAAQSISNAQVTGDTPASAELEFKPGKVLPGAYSFAVGTAGSATLVLQTILPPLMLAAAESDIILEGGTHNAFAPPFDFLAESFLPLINRMGPRVSATLERPGFYPAGGGRFTVHITPSATLKPLEMADRGDILARCAVVLTSGLSLSIAEREKAVLHKRLGWPMESLAIKDFRASSGPGNAVVAKLESAAVTAIFTSFGEKGRGAEAVAESVCNQVRRYLSSGAPVDEHLADQLLIPMALAGAGKFRAQSLTQHTLTNMDVITRFMELKFEAQRQADETYRVSLPIRARTSLLT